MIFRPPPVHRPRLLAALAVSALVAVCFAATDAAYDLLSDPNLTPKRFAAHFESFEFEAGREIQTPGEFLGRRRGDCDDYAVLADHVLSRRGYETRLVHIRLVGRVAHAVCYVTANSAYLDYNNRKYFLNLQRSGRSLRQIATKVAASFEGNWTSASEFTYDYDTRKKTFGATVVKTDRPENDPDLHPAGRRAGSG